MFGMASNTAGPSTNRWTMFVPAFCTHVCLGAPYGWSAISAQLTRENGILASGPLSVFQAGVRKSLALGGLLYGAGFCLASAGVYNHNVGMMYAGNRSVWPVLGCIITMWG